MIFDWNRNTLKKGTVFHFKHSLRPFIEVEDRNEDLGFLDINEMKIYNLDDLESEGLEFYEDETDEDFKGIEIDGIIEWVSI